MINFFELNKNKQISLTCTHLDTFSYINAIFEREKNRWPPIVMLLSIAIYCSAYINSKY